MYNKNEIGVGPHSKPWPTGNQYDPDLLEHGDSRNVIDKYRYWKVDAIKRNLDKSRNSLHIAIENWQHDFNIGTIVRNANAFNASAVHIIGKKQWNARGSMSTNLYMNVFHHKTVDQFVDVVQGLEIIAVDNQPGAIPLAEADLPEKAVLVFGGEGPGLSVEMIAKCKQMVAIKQYGSTRSVNVGVASGIAMYEWARRNPINQ